LLKVKLFSQLTRFKCS